MVNTHQRSVYKRFSFDFYKPDGSSGWEKINIKDDKKGPKKELDDTVVSASHHS